MFKETISSAEARCRLRSGYGWDRNKNGHVQYIVYCTLVCEFFERRVGNIQKTTSFRVFF